MAKVNLGLGGKPFTGEGKQSPRDYGKNTASESCTKDKVSYPNAWRDVGGEGAESETEKESGY